MRKWTVLTAVACVSRMAIAGGQPDGFEKNCHVFRGPYGNGLQKAGDLPTEWNERENKNILWKAKVGLGWASPIVWNGKVIALTADLQKRTAICFDAATGKQAWKTPIPKVAGATEEYELDTMDDRWNSLLHAGATPATDGKSVFAMFSNGQLVALDLSTGKVVWNIALGDTSGNKYGVDNSLVIYKNSVIAAFEGSPSFIAAYDTATGKELWKTERKNATWASPVLIATPGGKDLVVLTSDPSVTAWDAATGAQAWSLDVFPNAPAYCVGPSAVFADGVVVVNSENAGIFGIDPDKGTKLWGIEELPDGSGFPDGVSMATDGKLVFQYFKSALTAVEAKTGKVVKQKEMDEEAAYASPFFNDGKLYLFGTGAALIVDADPATDFEAAGKGSIEDTCDASPAVVNGRIFLRSDESLYAIGAKGGE